MIRDKILNGLADLGVTPVRPADAVADDLERYGRHIAEANRQFNLTAVADPVAMVERHFLDAAAGYGLLQAQGRLGGVAIDVGSGAGLPGVVWALLGGFDRIVCCESTGKKARFIAETVRVLGLEATVTVVTARAEDLGRQGRFRDKAHIVTARAVAPLRTLLELTIPLARVGGWGLFFKGQAAEGEIADAAGALGALNAAVLHCEPYAIPDSDHGGRLVVVEKRGKTPRQYPRLPGVPAKTPL